MGACTSLKVSRRSRFPKLATVSVVDWGHLKLWARQYAYVFIIQYIDNFNKYI
jgi:hypothetical protein